MMTRTSPRASMAAIALIAVVLALLVPTASASAATPQFGFRDQSTSGASEAPSGSKPESKLWFTDGIWWANMWDTASSTFHIFRLSASGQSWTDTGVVVDNRGSTRADALWAGSHLYIASHDVASDSSHNTANRPARLFRFSYNASTKTWTRDTGFPVTITTVAVETLVIERDSTGTLWATWTQAKKLTVAHTVGGDTVWGTPFTPAITGATALTSDDVSSLIAFGGNRIGVLWSNQSADHMYFTSHRDGDPDGTWTASEAATTGNGSADDHINLKADSAGRVYAAVKTSLTSSSSTLLHLLIRSSGGGWSDVRYGTVGESGTRPIVLIDEAAGKIHMFATGPHPGSSSGQSGGSIYEKTTTISSPSFGSGSGSPVIQDPSSSDMNNASSTKQNVSAASGIIVIATDDTRKFYWHSVEGYGGGSGPLAPTAAFSATPTAGSAPLAVQFTDTSSGAPTSWSWNFGDTASGAANTSTSRNPSHTYTAAGTYTVKLTAANSAGSDELTRTGFITVGSTGGSTVRVFNPAADSYVSSSNVNGNYGTLTTAKVREGAGTTTNPTYRTFLKFSLAGVSGTVSAVTLRLYVTDGSANTESVFLVPTSGWTETGITFANAPALGASVGSIATAAAGGYVTITLTPTTVSAATTTLSLAIRSSATDSLIVGTREDAAHRPELSVTFH